MSVFDFGLGVLVGYFIGVLKEKLRWVEKYISSRRSEQLLSESIEDEE